MRLFCAVELPPAARDALATAMASARARLERLGLDARWTPDENLHITAWFLGECDDAAADAVRQALSAPLPVAPFGMELGGWGAFPPDGAPRILWMGVRDAGASFARVHAALAARFVPLGYRPEPRPFHPHVTVARVRSRPSAPVTRAFRQLTLDPLGPAGRCWIADVTLFQSRLSPHGARYEPVQRVPLSE